MFQRMNACARLKSFLGYMILMKPDRPWNPRSACVLRSNRLHALDAVMRMDHEIHHNAMIKGMLAMQAMDVNLFVPTPDTVSVVSRMNIQIRLVMMLLANMETGPSMCIVETMRWIAAHPLGVQIARSKDFRGVVRMALVVAKPFLQHIPLLASPEVLRYMVRVKTVRPLTGKAALPTTARSHQRGLHSGGGSEAMDSGCVGGGLQRREADRSHCLAVHVRPRHPPRACLPETHRVRAGGQCTACGSAIPTTGLADTSPHPHLHAGFQMCSPDSGTHDVLGA